MQQFFQDRICPQDITAYGGLELGRRYFRLIGLYRLIQRAFRPCQLGGDHQAVDMMLVLIGVVTVLVPCGYLIKPLAQHLMALVLYQISITPIVLQPLQGFDESQLLVEFPQQQKPRIRGDLTTVKVNNNFSFKTQPKLRMTVCSHRTYLSVPGLWWFLALFLAQLVGLGGLLL